MRILNLFRIDYQEGGAIVSESFQDFDQRYLENALTERSPAFCGVTQLPFSVSDEEILDRHQKGVRALGFNTKRGGSEDLSKLDHFARRVHELAGWHSQLYIDSRNFLIFILLLNNYQPYPSTTSDYRQKDFRIF